MSSLSPSEELLVKLQDELELVNMALGELRTRVGYYSKDLGNDPVQAAGGELMKQKALLTIKIAALSKFLKA